MTWQPSICDKWMTKLPLKEQLTERTVTVQLNLMYKGEREIGSVSRVVKCTWHACDTLNCRGIVWLFNTIFLITFDFSCWAHAFSLDLHVSDSFNFNLYFSPSKLYLWLSTQFEVGSIPFQFNTIYHMLDFV